MMVFVSLWSFDSVHLLYFVEKEQFEHFAKYLFFFSTEEKKSSLELLLLYFHSVFVLTVFECE